MSEQHIAVSELLSSGVVPCAETYRSISLHLLSCGRPLGHHGPHYRWALADEPRVSLAWDVCAGCRAAIQGPRVGVGQRWYHDECYPRDHGCPHEDPCCSDCEREDYAARRADELNDELRLGL